MPTAELLIPPEVLELTQPCVTEGPVWRNGRLYFVDIPSGMIFEVSSEGQVLTKRSFGSTLGMIGAIQPCTTSPDHWVVACQRGFALIDLHEESILSLHEVELPENARFNDGKVGPDGAFYAGSCEMSFQKSLGALWRYAGPQDCRKILEGLYLPNGLDWSQDGERFYFIDSKNPERHCVEVYDWNGSTIGPLRERLRLSEKESPLTSSFDGLCLDQDENLYVAIWDEGRVVRWVEGREERSIPVPVRHPTSCCFGGQNGEFLFVTSERIPGEGGNAGGIFRVDLAAAERPGRRKFLFAG